MFRFVGSANRYTEIFGLLTGKLGQFDTELIEVQSCNLFIKCF